jgi:hypothetical protein
MKTAKIMHCDCGRLALEVKKGSPVCDRCKRLEEAGCVGGPYKTNARRKTSVLIFDCPKFTTRTT